VQDQIKVPNRGGYRALHINFWLDVGDHPFQVERLPCEVQIRSRLQDAWAVLSHDDIYKQEDLPDDLRARFKDLAEMLSAADRIASDIRGRVRQEATPPAERPSFDTVTEAGLAFIFSETFGRSARDFLLRQAESMVAELGIESLRGLSELLTDDGFRSKAEAAYRFSMPLGPSAEETFLAGLRALKVGAEHRVGPAGEKARWTRGPERHFRNQPRNERGELRQSERAQRSGRHLYGLRPARHDLVVDNGLQLVEQFGRTLDGLLVDGRQLSVEKFLHELVQDAAAQSPCSDDALPVRRHVYDEGIRHVGAAIRIAFTGTVPDDGFGRSIDAFALGYKDRFGLLVELGAGGARFGRWQQVGAKLG